MPVKVSPAAGPGAGTAPVVIPAAEPAAATPAPVAEALAGAAAPEPAATESPAEAPAKEEKKSASARAIEAADRARKAAQKNRELQIDRSQLEATARHQATQIQELGAQLAQMQRALHSFEADPVAALKARGLSPADIAKAVAREGSPEAMLAKMQAQLEAQNAEIQRIYDKERQGQIETARLREENLYKQEAANPKKYPNIATIPPDFVLARTKDLIRDLERRVDPTTGQPVDVRRFSNDDLLSYLDSVYAKEEASRPETDDADAPAEKSVARKKTATVTNRMKTDTAAAPADFDRLSDKQQKAWMAKQIAALSK